MEMHCHIDQGIRITHTPQFGLKEVLHSDLGVILLLLQAPSAFRFF